MPIRGYNKAYQDGGLIDEYSVQVGLTKYPILSDKYKGFLSNKTRNGIAKMNKIKKMSDEQRSEYLVNCNSVLCMDSDRAKADVGDKPSPKNKTKEIQIKDVNLVSGSVNIPIEDIPESIEAMVKSVKNELPIEEPSNNAIPAQTMAKGGLVEGSSHLMGGVDMHVGKCGKKVNLEGGEFVINKVSTINFKAPLKKMNDAGNNLRQARTEEEKKEAKERLKKMREKLQSFKQGGIIPKSEIKHIDTQTEGLDAQFQKDDSKKDIGMYQTMINKYFTVLDFTRVLAYVKIKNKKVESMKSEEILDTSKDLAQELSISQLKYMDNDIKMLKAQLYELLALAIGKSKQPDDKKDYNNVGFIVDIESVYGDGRTFNKEKFAETFMEGGQIPPDITNEPKPTVVNQGMVSQKTQVQPLTTKPVYGALPSSITAKNEGSFIDEIKPTTRRMFNLADAVLKFESSNAQRFSKPIDEALEEFKVENIFRFKKDDKPRTFNLF